MLKFIHAADFHLDSAFAALPAGRAAERRRESRELAFRLAACSWCCWRGTFLTAPPLTGRLEKPWRKPWGA